MSSATLDSVAAFKQRALSVGLTEENYDKLRASGYDTYGKLAFATGANPATVEDQQVDDWIKSVIDPPQSKYQASVIRRLLYESQSLNIADLKSRIDGPSDSQVKKLPAAERIARIAEQQGRISGLVFDARNMPAHSCVDQCLSMIEQNSFRYLAPSKWVSRAQELASVKQDPLIQVESDGAMRVKVKQNEPSCDTAGIATSLPETFVGHGPGSLVQL